MAPATRRSTRKSTSVFASSSRRAAGKKEETEKKEKPIKKKTQEDKRKLKPSRCSSSTVKSPPTITTNKVHVREKVKIDDAFLIPIQEKDIDTKDSSSTLQSSPAPVLSDDGDSTGSGKKNKNISDISKIVNDNKTKTTSTAKNNTASSKAGVKSPPSRHSIITKKKIKKRLEKHKKQKPKRSGSKHSGKDNTIEDEEKQELQEEKEGESDDAHEEVADEAEEEEGMVKPEPEPEPEPVVSVVEEPKLDKEELEVANVKHDEVTIDEEGEEIDKKESKIQNDADISKEKEGEKEKEEREGEEEEKEEEEEEDISCRDNGNDYDENADNYALPQIGPVTLGMEEKPTTVADTNIITADNNKSTATYKVSSPDFNIYSAFSATYPARTANMLKISPFTQNNTIAPTTAADTNNKSTATGTLSSSDINIDTAYSATRSARPVTSGTGSAEKLKRLSFVETNTVAANSSHVTNSSSSSPSSSFASSVIAATQQKSISGNNYNCNSKRSLDHCQWETMFEKLLEFKKEYGHCRVPRRYPNNPKLGRWVAKQRTEYVHFQNSDRRPLITKERIKRLERINFEWAVRKKYTQRTKQTWMQVYMKLLEYQKFHGTCNPSPTRDIVLYRWAEQQRYNYWNNNHNVLMNTSSKNGGNHDDDDDDDDDDSTARIAKPVDDIVVDHNDGDNSDGDMEKLTPRRIQLLQGIGFEWKPSTIYNIHSNVSNTIAFGNNNPLNNHYFSNGRNQIVDSLSKYHDSNYFNAKQTAGAIPQAPFTNPTMMPNTGTAEATKMTAVTGASTYQAQGKKRGLPLNNNDKRATFSAGTYQPTFTATAAVAPSLHYNNGGCIPGTVSDEYSPSIPNIMSNGNNNSRKRKIDNRNEKITIDLKNKMHYPPPSTNKSNVTANSGGETGGVHISMDNSNTLASNNLNLAGPVIGNIGMDKCEDGDKGAETKEELHKEKIRNEEVKDCICDEEEGFTSLSTHVLHQWHHMLYKLLVFETVHGHARVPFPYSKDPSLGAWVQEMKSQKNALVPGQIKKLNALGFEWGEPSSSDSVSHAPLRAALPVAF